MIHETPTRKCKLAIHITPGERVVMSPEPNRMLATVAEVHHEHDGVVHFLMVMGQVETWVDLRSYDWLEMGEGNE